MKIPQFKHLPALALGLLGIAATAHAQYITASPNLPPIGAIYDGSGIFGTYNAGGMQYVITLAQDTVTLGISNTPLGGDELESYFSQFDAMLEVFSGATSVFTSPISVTANTLTRTFSKIGNVTGTFNAEMLQFDINSGMPLGLLLRESPTLFSNGGTSVQNFGSLYQINSFFDVFTELSTDGGQNWSPTVSGSGHIAIVPEPGSTSLLALGAVSVAGFVRRRR